MAVQFSDEQVQQATGAARTRPGGRASYTAVCTDSRQVTAGCLFVALAGERFDAHDFVQQALDRGAAGLVVKRGRALTLSSSEVALYEVDDTLVALGALAHFHRERFKVPVGAVTGSNGKTTTKELVAAILGVRGPALKTQGNLNNEIGGDMREFADAREAVRAFQLAETDGAGQPVTQFNQPLTLVVTYTDTELAALGLNEESLDLVYWDGAAWVTLLPCAGCSIDRGNNRITVVINHFSEFAVTASARLYLPVVQAD